MKVGTIETLEPEKKIKRRTGLSGGGKSDNGQRGRGGGGNNGGGDGPNRQDFSETEDYQPIKSQVLMWFLLLIVFMTFGGLVAAYIVISTNGVQEWRVFTLPKQLWFSTLLIFASSLTYIKAQNLIFRNNQPQAKKWLTATTVLGATFISSQLLVWLDLVRQGVYVQSNPYAGFFYIMTAVHAAHVLGGIIALGTVVLRMWNRPVSEFDLAKSQMTARVVGWYWHFMGLIWATLFLLLNFWK